MTAGGTVGRAPIYLDHNATTPIDPAVRDAMRPYLGDRFGNPSSAHGYGRAARAAVDRARAEVASLLGAAPEEIVFTGGGSEADNQAVFGAARARPGGHVVTTAVEHPAVLAPCRALAREGTRLTIVGVDEAGRVDAARVAESIEDDTRLVTVMHANNEVGTIQPVAEIARLARARGAWVHTDAAQSVGKVEVDVRALDVDLLTVAGHKLYAPKGVGALYVRAGIDLPPLIYGAAHESGRRAGTENVPGIVGLGRACALALERGRAAETRLRDLRERLYAALSSSDLEVRRHGDPGASLPNTLSVAFVGVDASALLRRVEDRVAASAGAACHGDDVRASTVLVAMGVPPALARSTIRLSLGVPTTEREVDEAAACLLEAARAQT